LSGLLVWLFVAAERYDDYAMRFMIPDYYCSTIYAALRSPFFRTFVPTVNWKSTSDKSQVSYVVRQLLSIRIVPAC
jgi:hypothetical protein